MILRESFLKAHPLCQAAMPEICTKIASQVHHKQGRVGELYLDDTTFLAVCGPCHQWIELHPDSAKDLGLSQSRLQTNESTQKEETKDS